MALPEPVEPVNDGAVSELGSKLSAYLSIDSTGQVSVIGHLGDQLACGVAWLHLLHASIGNSDRYHVIQSLVHVVYQSLQEQRVCLLNWHAHVATDTICMTQLMQFICIVHIISAHIKLSKLIDSPPILLLIRGCASPPASSRTMQELLEMSLQFRGSGMCRC